MNVLSDLKPTSWMTEITIDEQGQSKIGNGGKNPGRFACNLKVGDRVELEHSAEPDRIWTVVEIGSTIHTRQGRSNFVYVTLASV